jgi:hypothetical protein
LLFLSLCVVTQVGARERGQVPEAYGRSFIRAAAVQTNLIPPLQSAPEGPAYLQRVQQQQWQGGPYGAGLSQSLLDAANYFQSRGDSEQAVTLLKQSVHLTRINDGLYSSLQLPLLKSLLKNYINFGDLEAASEIQSWIFHLQQENYQQNDPAYVAAAIEFAAWQRKLWILNPDPEEPDRLHRVWQQLDQLVPPEEADPLPVTELQSLVYARMQLLYLISVADFGLDQETEMMLGRSYAREQAQPNVARSQMQRLKKAAFSRGVGLLESLLERLENSPDYLARAEVQRQLGDWQMWFAHKSRAATHYTDAWRTLDADASGQRRQAWFGDPVELPAGGILYAGAAPQGEVQESTSLTASFSVSARGRPGEIEILLTDEEEQAGRYRLLRLLKKTRFRPRMEAGELVETPNLQREYELLL